MAALITRSEPTTGDLEAPLLRLPILAPLVFALCGPQVVSQSTTILPRGSSGLVDRYLDIKLGAESRILPVHVQHAYALADLKSTSMAVRSIAWRRSNFVRNEVAASSTTLDVRMSHTSFAPAKMRARFADNRGSDQKLVFSGRVQWPAVAWTQGPASFDFAIKLQTPFVVGRKPSRTSLVVDCRVTARSHRVGSREVQLPIDGVGPAEGSWETNGARGVPRNCLDSRNRYNNGLSFDLRALTNEGGKWHVSYTGILPNAPGITMISAYGSGQRYATIRLPIDLAGFGMPACFFNVGLEGVWIPWAADRLGIARLPDLTIPDKLGGAAFYDQGLYVDAAANKRGLVSCWSSKWTITRQVSFACARLSRLRDVSQSPTGSLELGSAAILELRP